MLRCPAVLLAAVFSLGMSAAAQPPEPKPAPAPAAPAAPSAAAPADLPTAEALFTKHVAAAGGMEGLRSQKSAVIKARIVRPGAPTGLLTVWRKAPDKMYKIMDFPGVATLETWCDGTDAWIRDSNKGAARLTGDGLVETKIEAQFLGEADFKARYKELKTTEKTTFADRPVYAVAATTVTGRARTLYFDAEKSFLIGMRFAIPGPNGDVQYAITFADYKQYGASWQPTVVIEDDGKVKTTTTFTQIEMDVTLMPSLDPPDEIKNLKK